MAHGKNVVLVDDASFEAEVLKADGAVLVDFGATWCPPCKALAPIVEELAAENVGRIKVVVIDTDDSPLAAARYGVRGVPTVLVFRNGEKVAQHVGLTTKAKLGALVGL